MKRKLLSLFLSLSLMVVSVTGCQSDSVTEETKKEVQTKKSQVLSLYKEIETMIQKNHIEADADFAKMKEKLTSMSKKVDEKIEDTTEEDAKQANTITALTRGVSYLDATVNGMGRGAGNCASEQLLGFLKNPKYDIIPLLKFLEKHIVPLKESGVVS